MVQNIGYKTRCVRYAATACDVDITLVISWETAINFPLCRRQLVLQDGLPCINGFFSCTVVKLCLLCTCRLSGIIYDRLQNPTDLRFFAMVGVSLSPNVTWHYTQKIYCASRQFSKVSLVNNYCTAYRINCWLYLHQNHKGGVRCVFEARY
jgi:hypothetical protein